MDLKQYLDEIVSFLQNQVKKANAKGLIVGLSGGIDSAVVALLIKKAFANNHLVLIMPCLSPKIDLDCALKLVKEHNLNYKIVNLDNVFLQYQTLLANDIDEKNSKIILGNLKARLRMATLYVYAQNNGYLVSGTDNADEWHIGYFTKYGDGGCDLLPIVRLLKKDVFAAAKILGVCSEITSRVPSASLWPGQTDEQEMGFSYQDLDNYLLNDTSKLSSQTIKRIEYLNKISQHKRMLVPLAPQWNSKK